MLEKAIGKIKSEMNKENNPYVKVVGEFLLQYLNENPEAAEKILATDKSIVKSLTEMRKAAEKKKVGNCAVLTDQEGFGIVLKYFEIDAPAGQHIECSTAPRVAEPVKKESEIDFDVKLEDFLV